MKRRQLFEFNEAAWLPAGLRAMITDFLRTLIELLEPFSPQLPLIVRALRSAGEGAGVVDLGSGSGGPWRHLSPQLNRLAGRSVPITLTDKYPDPDTTAQLPQPADVVYHPLPVDARAIPENLRGLRSLFDGFHQFRRADAVAIIANSVAQQQPIVIMELMRRSALDLGVLVFTPLLVWVLTPWIRPFSWRRLTLTYLVPVAPLIILWDSLISTLRCWRPDELLALAREAGGAGYQWHAGNYRHRGAPVTFLIGYPRERTGAAR